MDDAIIRIMLRILVCATKFCWQTATGFLRTTLRPERDSRVGDDSQPARQSHSTESHNDNPIGSLPSQPSPPFASIRVYSRFNLKLHRFTPIIPVTFTADRTFSRKPLHCSPAFPDAILKTRFSWSKRSHEPGPLHTRRLQWRGENHACARAAAALGFDAFPECR